MQPFWKCFHNNVNLCFTTFRDFPKITAPPCDWNNAYTRGAQTGLCEASFSPVQSSLLFPYVSWKLDYKWGFLCLKRRVQCQWCFLFFYYRVLSKNVSPYLTPSRSDPDERVSSWEGTTAAALQVITIYAKRRKERSPVQVLFLVFSTLNKTPKNLLSVKSSSHAFSEFSWFKPSFGMSSNINLHSPYQPYYL